MTFSATDAAGNKGTAVANVVVSVAPATLTIALSEPPDGAVLGSSPAAVRGAVSNPNAWVHLQEKPVPVYTGLFEGSVSLSEGPNEITATGRDASGASATTSRTVILDTTPPVVTIHSPKDRALLTIAPANVTAFVEDATAVTCTLAGQPATVASGWVRGPVGLVSGENTIAVSCRDAAGNETQQSRVVFYDGSPLWVRGFAPPDGADSLSSGARITVVFSEPIRPASLTANSFFVRHGTTVLPAALVVAGDALSGTLVPEGGVPPAADLEVTVTTGVTDAAGNPLSAPVVAHYRTLGQAAVSGSVIGEVFDDVRGLPLAGADVEALAADSGATLGQATTDERGRYQLGPFPADAILVVSKTGFTSSTRINVVASSATEVLDARLTAVEASQTIDPLLPSVVKSGGHQLRVPPGALGVPAPVGLTAVGPQGPQSPFPIGWAPLGIVEVRAPGDFGPVAQLDIADKTAAAVGRQAAIVRYDAASRSWLMVLAATVSTEGVATLPDVTSPGQYALVLPDDGTSAPPWPALGSALSGTTAQALPDTATASGHVTPAVGRADDPTPAKAVVTVLSPADLPSGTLIRGDFSELFSLFGSGSIAGVSSSQDLVVYRRPGQADGRSLTAEFAVAPSRTFSPAALKEGTITVTILRREMLSRTLVGAAGGGFRAPDGSRVVIPPGALTDPVPVDLTRVAESDFPSIAGSGWTFLGGLKLDLWSAVPSASLELTLAGAGSVAGSGRTIVVAKVVGVLGQDRLEIVAMGRVAGADATSVASWNGVTFPGVRSEGRYAFYVSPSAMTPVTGTARDAAGRREGHRVSCDGVPFVSLTDVAGAFEVICAPGAFRLRAGQAASRDEAVAEGQTGTPFPEIVIVPLPPRVEAIAVRSPKLDGNWAGPIALLAQPRPVVDDDAAGDSLGDGDGLVEAGERVELSFHVRNDGTVTVEGAMLELRFRHAGGPATCARDIVTGITLVPDAPVAIGPFVCEIPASADAGTIVYTLLRRTADGKFLTQSSFTLPFDVEHHGVPLDSEIAVTFTEAVTIPADGYSLVREDGGPGTAVETKLSVGADGATATVRPLAALAGSARYRLVLGAAIVDGDGRALDGAPVTVRISTVDTTPPPPIDPAHIEASAPDADGFVTVTATAGSANPTDTVILLNNTSGAAVTTEPGSDGSFEAKVVAQPGDRLSVILRDINGNKTTIDPGPLIRRDPVTGDVTGVVLTTSGGTVPGPGGINLTVSAGSARGGVEMSVSLVAEPFALPADIVADASLASAFAAAFSPLARFNIQSSIRAFGVPLQLTMPAPVGSAVGDVFVIVRHRAVTIGGALADLEGVTGIAAADNPAHSVQRLEIVDSATVKDDLGAIVLSSDSAPLAGILEPGVYTVLRVLEPLTLVAGTVRRDTSSGLAVSGSVVSSLPAAVATAAFAAITNRQGAFVAADAALGGPQPPGAVLSSRLDAFDPRYRRIIRRDVRGEVRPPIPPGTSVVHLSEPLLLPSTLPSALIAVLGDVEPPQVAIQLEGAPLENGLVRAGDPLTIRVTVTDDDRVAFTWLEVNTGAEIQGIALASDGTGQFTPTDGLFTLVARARDSAGNEGTASTIIRAVAAPAGQPLVPTPLPGRSPEALGSAEPGGGGAGQPDARLARPAGDAAAAADAGAPSILHAVPSDGSLMFVFSEPLALSTVTEVNVKVLDPEGEEVDIDLYFGVGNSGVWVKAARHFRYGAVYTLKMSSGIRDLNGESFAGLEMKFYIPQPVQAATIELQNAEDVVLVGENLAVSKTDAEGGSVRLYQVTEAMDPLTPFAPLALLPEPKLLSTFTTRGLPWALAADGDRLYVANRFRGFWGEEATGYYWDYGQIFGFPTSYIWQTQMPAPVSHLSVYDVSDPSAPAFSTGAVLNFFSVNNWNPANWVRRLEITPQGLGVVNFLENIEMFTLSEPPASRGVVELHWWDPGQRPGRCNGDPTGSPCLVPSFKDHITFGSNPQLADQICSGRCVNTTEFYDAAFFDGFAVSVDQAGLRILSTAPEDMSRASGSDRSLSFYPLGTAPFGRVGSVMGYAWTDQQGVARVSDLAFVATPRDRTLRIFDVTAPSSPVLLSETLNVVGNMSFDSTAGLAYIFGFQGEFHVIDFIDPTRPLKLNDPGANSELLPFSVTGLGGTSSFNGNTNRRGIVYVASWDGVAIVDTRAEPDVETACENLGPCRTNTWQPGLGCVRSAKPDGFSCEDGLFCNGAETCRAGVCSSGLAPWMDDGVGCTADRCNEQLDRRMNVPDDSVCASGDCFNGKCDRVRGCQKDPMLAGVWCGPFPAPDACTFPSECDGNGACIPGTPYLTAEDGQACSEELPKTWRNGACKDTWRLDHTQCSESDGKTCTVPRCEPGGGCVEVPDDTKCAGILDPGDKCHSSNCDPTDPAADAATGCVIKDLPDGTSCEDGAFCNGHEDVPGRVLAAGQGVDAAARL